MNGRKLVIFKTMSLFKIQVKPPISQNLKCLLFSYLLGQEKHMQNEILQKRSF